MTSRGSGQPIWLRINASRSHGSHLSPRVKSSSSGSTLNPQKQLLQQLLRKGKLLGVADDVRFLLQRVRLASKNRQVRHNFPCLSFPPASLLYEIGGNLDLERYLQGVESARFLVETLEKHARHPESVLDWGCGVSCVCRHLPEILPKSCPIFACDINAEMIKWGRTYLPEIEYSHTSLLPPLPFPAHRFDWIYGLSVMTHLNESTTTAWLNEMKRVLTRRGVLLVTLNGTNVRHALLRSEVEGYEKGEFIVRDGIAEGRKMFLSFCSPERFRRMVANEWEILDFLPGGMPLSKQDVWVLSPGGMP